MRRFRYDIVAGPYTYWAEGSACTSGWNAAKGLKWNDPQAAECKTISDMHDGYINGQVGRNGFYVVIKVVLTQEQLDEIAETKHKKALEKAKMELKWALEKVAKLNA